MGALLYHIIVIAHLGYACNEMTYSMHRKTAGTGYNYDHPSCEGKEWPTRHRGL